MPKEYKITTDKDTTRTIDTITLSLIPILTSLSLKKGIKIFFSLTEFKGQATGPAVIQGDYESGNIGGIHFVAPPSIYYSYKEYISIVPDLLMKYRKEFEDSVGIEADYNLCDKYNKVFLVNLNGSMNGSILVNQMNYI